MEFFYVGPAFGIVSGTSEVFNTMCCYIDLFLSLLCDYMYVVVQLYIYV